MLHNAATLGLLRRDFSRPPFQHFGLVAVLGARGRGVCFFSVDVGTKPPRQRRYPVVPALCYSSGLHARTYRTRDLQTASWTPKSTPVQANLSQFILANAENFREAERGLRSCLSLTGTRSVRLWWPRPGSDRPPCSPDCPAYQASCFLVLGPD